MASTTSSGSPSMSGVLCSQPCPARLPRSPGPRGRARPAPSYLGCDWTSPRFPAPAPSASSLPPPQPAVTCPAPLPEELAWPGPALGRGVWARTGEGRAHNHVRQIQSAGRGGEEDRRCVASRALRPSLGEGRSRSAGLWRSSPPQQALGEMWGGCFPIGPSAGREKSIRPHGIRAKL